MGGNFIIILVFYIYACTMQLRNGKIKGYQIQDDHCPICLDVLYMPTKTYPCRHTFCNTCLKQLKQFDRNESVKCPTCRTEIDKCLFDPNMADILSFMYPKELIQRRQHEENHVIFSALPERAKWYEKFTFGLICLPIDIINFAFLYLFLIMKILAFASSFVTSPLADAVIQLTYQLWQQFYIFLLDVTKFLNSIRRSNLYSNWKKGFAFSVCCIWVLIMHIVLTKMNEILKWEEISIEGRLCCNALLLTEYIFLHSGFRSLSQTLMTIATQFENE